MKNPIRSFKIVSKGAPIDTEIFDSDGNRIGCIQKITIDIDIKNPVVVATMEVILPELDIEVSEEDIEFINIPLRELGNADIVRLLKIPVKDK